MRVIDLIESSKRYQEWIRKGEDEIKWKILKIIRETDCLINSITSEFKISPCSKILKYNETSGTLVCLYQEDEFIESKRFNYDDESDDYARYLYRSVIYKQMTGENLKSPYEVETSG